MQSSWHRQQAAATAVLTSDFDDLDRLRFVLPDRPFASNLTLEPLRSQRPRLVLRSRPEPPRGPSDIPFDIGARPS
jgi:hypothetical protein